LHKTQESTTT